MADLIIHKYPLEKVFDHNGYPSVGHCIYCGSHAPDQRLTKEHIVGRALGGTITLARSTCATCQKTTRAIEEFCFNEMMRAFRLKTGFPSSHPKHAPITIRAREGDDPQTILHLSRHELPGAIVAPKFPPPELTHGTWQTTTLSRTQTYYVHFLHDGPSTVSTSQTLPFTNRNELKPLGFWLFFSDMRWPPNTVFTLALNATIYARMLAKIAHAYACAEVGHSAFEAFLPNLITDSNSNPFQFVGCIGQVGSSELPAEDCLHRLSLECWEMDAKLFLVVKIRLLAFIGAPEYHVLVGAVSEVPKAKMRRAYMSKIRSGWVRRETL